MNFIYGIALFGLFLLGVILLKNMRWKVETVEWLVLKGIEKDHSQARQIAAYLEQNNIPAKVELQKQSTMVRLLYSKKMTAIIKVKSQDYQQAASLVEEYLSGKQHG